jgi:RecB family endonuclease NucS
VLTLVRREYPTDIGSVDLMCRDVSSASVAVGINHRGD